MRLRYLKSCMTIMSIIPMIVIMVSCHKEYDYDKSVFDQNKTLINILHTDKYEHDTALVWCWWYEADRIDQTFLSSLDYHGEIESFCDESKRYGKVINWTVKPKSGSYTSKDENGNMVKKESDIYDFQLGKYGCVASEPSWWNLDTGYRWYSMKKKIPTDKTGKNIYHEDIYVFISKDGKKVFVNQVNYARGFRIKP